MHIKTPYSVSEFIYFCTLHKRTPVIFWDLVLRNIEIVTIFCFCQQNYATCEFKTVWTCSILFSKISFFRTQCVYFVITAFVRIWNAYLGVVV